MPVSVEQIKNLRSKTGAGIMDCKKALEESGGDMEKAEKMLQERGVAKAAKKSDRKASEGWIAAYVHATGKIGAMVELFCETDFVARTEDFQKLGHELAMQVAATDPEDLDELLGQDYIRDPAKTVKDLINETIAKVGENVRAGRFVRFEI